MHCWQLHGTHESERAEASKHEPREVKHDGAGRQVGGKEHKAIAGQRIASYGEELKHSHVGVEDKAERIQEARQRQPVPK